MSRRDDLVVAAVTVAALGVMATNAAAAQSRWTWIGWAAAVPFLLLLSPSVESWLRARVVAAPALRVRVPVALVVIGLVAALANGTVPWWRVALWPLCIAGAVAAVGRDRTVEYGGGRLVAGALALGLAAGAWDRSFKIAVPGGTSMGFTFLTAVALALFLYRVVRPLRTLDVRLALSRRELLLALAAAAAVAIVALPAGFATGFVVFNPKWHGVAHAAAKLLGLVVFVGVPEELLFRGLIQEGLSRLRGPRTGWIAASLLFGLTHITKPTGLPPAIDHVLRLNWRYALLAAIAGLAYGWVYRRTGKVSAAALTHGAVNWLWSTYFGR